mgnify:CR=1 FL=1
MLPSHSFCGASITTAAHGRSDIIEILDNKPDARFDALRTWVSGIDGFAGADFHAVSTDASFRHYYRVTVNGACCIEMDAPPPAESCEKFVRIANWLREMSLNCPHILQQNTEQGFLLISDLGERLYLDEITRQPSATDSLYRDALAALRLLQSRGQYRQSQLPPYDARLLQFELSIFREWLCEKHLQLTFTSQESGEWKRCCEFLVDAALAQPRVFVHRDYHSRNLMVTPTNNPGILDFQDALEGHLTYDVVSLLRDCYFCLPKDKVREWALHYHASLPGPLSAGLTAGDFLRFFDLAGAQRHLKAAGIFARLLTRDAKPGYMRDVPRTLRYVSALAPKYPQLEFVGALIDERILPALGSLHA